MRSKSIWILAAAVCVAGYSAYSDKDADASRPPGLSVPGGDTPSSAAVPAQPAGATGVPAADAPAPAAPTAAAAAPGRVERYEALLSKARERGDRVDQAIYAAALVHASGSAGHQAGLAHSLRLEGDAVRAANRAAAARDASTQRAELTVAFLACLDATRRERYEAILTTLAEAEILSTRSSKDAVIHRVESGDSLAKIGKRYAFPVEGLMRVNRLQSDRIRIGQSIKIPRGTTRVVVFKSEFLLAHLRDGRLVATYRVGIGKDDSTPEASFEIVDRQVDPTWFGPNGVFKPGEPGNLLGTRWLGFRNTDEHQGFGIHGTVFPESIGKAESSGCIRLANEQVEALFGYVESKAQVTIVR